MSERWVKAEETYTQQSRRVPVATTIRTTGRRAIPEGRCTGFALGDGNYSGCAIGDGEEPTKFGGDVCQACNNTGLAVA